MTTAADIAKGLTKAQREALLGPPNHEFYPWRWEVRRSTEVVLVLRGLWQKGRIHGPTSFTPLGLEVRAVLQAQEPNS